MDNLIGKKLDGRYLIESLIGVGGMANVYKGTDTKTGNAIAVKVLKEEFLDNEELVRRFKNESKAISILDHPNIVKVYDVSVTDKLQYIVMEYIDGITLKEYLKQRGGALTWKEVVHFATQVLSALDHAHSKGIVHRDVKPQNIMLQANGSIKMMDFGIARFSRAQSQTVSDKAIGSVHYISPEQAKGDHTDARTDIYSVGVMLYEMLSGRLPFDGSGTVSIAIMQISEKPKPLAEIAPDVPAGLRQITEKAMEKDPADRYQSAKEMLDAINAFKQNPSIQFEYQYNTQDTPSKTINRVVSGSRGASVPKAGRSATKSGITTTQARRMGTIAKGKNVKSKTKKSKKGQGLSVLPVFAGVAVAFVIGAAILCYLIFTNSTNPLFSNRNDVQLIDFVGWTEDKFRASEYYTQLVPEWDYDYNSTYPEGTIYDQYPKSGRTVKEGQQVTLRVSLGTQYITVPDVAGYSSDNAKTTLQDLGLSVVTNFVEDASVAAGTVVSTEPAANTTVQGQTTVIVYVSREIINAEEIVPSLTGLTESTARSTLASSGFTSIQTVQQASDQPAGTVLRQYPNAGDSYKKSGTIYLWVSTGVAATPEPVDTGASDGEGQTWDQEFPEGSGNWVTCYRKDGHNYRSDTGEMIG